jgi:hypothetical protein
MITCELILTHLNLQHWYYWIIGNMKINYKRLATGKRTTTLFSYNEVRIAKMFLNIKNISPTMLKETLIDILQHASEDTTQQTAKERVIDFMLATIEGEVLPTC